MPTFSGRFQYLEETGAAAQSGSCRVTIEQEKLLLIPEKGPQLALDLGDIDAFSPADYQLSLKVYTGKTILLSQFGKTFQNLCHDLLEAYRSRLVQCLLLEDLEEIARFDGSAQLDSAEPTFSSRAELRLYKSNLAVLPEAATGFQWRLADIDAVDFDEPTYTLGLRSGGDRLILTKLAKRTHEFIERLQSAMDDLSKNSAGILHSLFPFLPPDQFRQVADLMKEGRAVEISKLRATHSKVERVLLEKTVDAHLKPYFDLLKKQAVDECFFAGFKLIRPETEDGDADIEPAESPQGSTEESETTAAAPEPEVEESESEQEPVLHWFFFPLRAAPEAKAPADLVAWESTSRSGRATYFFRILLQDQAGQLLDPTRAPAALESAIQRLNRALILLNFKREPIYLSDESFETQPRYRRYAIACRKIPVLRQLRTSFLGRALHTSPEAWQKQVQSILARV
jgi:hypothetical protein